MAKKETTNDELARMVQVGFSEVHEEITTLRDQMGAEFKSVRNEMDSMSNGMDSMSDRMVTKEDLLH